MSALTPADASRFTVAGRFRSSGIWHHPNELSHAVMPAAAACIGLLISRVKILPLLGASFIVGGIYIATVTRGHIIISGVLLLLLVVSSNRKTRIARPLGILTLVVLLAVIFAAPEELSDRWFGEVRGFSAYDNFIERVGTILASVQLLLQSPWGLGFQGRQVALVQLGYGASHNGFLSLGLTFGFIPVATLFAIFIALWRRAAKYGVYQISLLFSITSVYLSLLFEDAVYNPTIITVITLFSFVLLSSYRHTGTGESGLRKIS